MDTRRAIEPDMSTNPGINITPIMGSLFWGTLLSMVLTGIMVQQAYHYFPSKDRPVVQLIALSMFLLDLISTSLTCLGLHYYLLPHFGSMIPFDSLIPMLAAECVATTCIIAISQLYFAWQIYAVSQKYFVKYIISGAVAIISLLAFAGGLGCSVVMFIRPANILANRNDIFNVTAALAKAPAAVADIIATFALCYSLGYAKTGLPTDSVLKTLIGFVIQRGVVVTLIQTVFLAMFYALPSHLYWLGFHVNVTRVYANTFFAMLNGRETLKKEFQMKSHAPPGLGTYNEFNVSKKEVDGEADAIEAQQSVWMDTIKRGNPINTMGIAQIQVDRRVMMSNM